MLVGLSLELLRRQALLFGHMSNQLIALMNLRVGQKKTWPLYLCAGESCNSLSSP